MKLEIKQKGKKSKVLNLPLPKLSPKQILDLLKVSGPLLKANAAIMKLALANEHGKKYFEKCLKGKDSLVWKSIFKLLKVKVS